MKFCGEENKQIYLKAKKTWGKKRQILVAIEELSECAAALTRTVSGKLKNMDELHSELADAEIMLEQMRLYFSSSSIDKWKTFKLKRLGKRLKKYK